MMRQMCISSTETLENNFFVLQIQFLVMAGNEINFKPLVNHLQISFCAIIAQMCIETLVSIRNMRNNNTKFILLHVTTKNCIGRVGQNTFPVPHCAKTYRMYGNSSFS